MSSIGNILGIGQKARQTQTALVVTSARLLAMDANALARELDSAIESNPFLERSEEPLITPEREGSGAVADSVYEDWGRPQAEEEEEGLYDIEDLSLSTERHLQENLAEQLRFSQAPARIKLLAAWIIGNLDEDGFLAEPLTALVDASDYDDNFECWEEALALVQSFDPPGIGASSPTEALVLQLRRLKKPAALRLVAERLLTECETEIRRHNPRMAAQKLGTSQAVVEEALALITTLNPVPGAQFEAEETRYITPELILCGSAGAWTVELNPATLPRIRFDHQNFDRLKKSRLQGEDIASWKTKARDAKLFIRALEQRFATIVATAQTLVDLQSAFFNQGESFLKPLTLQDVALRLNLSASTVSRATAGKYIQTARGVLELKSLFPGPVPTNSGVATSTAELVCLLREFVAAENPKHPLSDAQLAQKLEKKGLLVARRTVTKYRLREGIPAACVRRRP